MEDRKRKLEQKLKQNTADIKEKANEAGASHPRVKQAKEHRMGLSFHFFLSLSYLSYSVIALPPNHNISSGADKVTQRNPAQAPPVVPNPVQDNAVGAAPRLKPNIQARQQQQQVQPPPESELPGGQHIGEHPDCKEEIAHYCPKANPKHDLGVVLCIEGERQDTDYLSDACQHVIWQYKLAFTTSDHVPAIAQRSCAEDLKKTPGLGDCTKDLPKDQNMVSCMMDYKENITDPTCVDFITKAELLVFTDYRFTGRMMESCKKEIHQFSCGRIDTTEYHPHSQGATIDCLMQKLSDLGKTDPGDLNPHCQRELLRIAELQADDYHLDRPLFFACRDDREHFCSTITAGEGRVLSCLLQHRLDREMSEACGQKLLVRARLMAQDYRIAHPLVKGCRKELQAYQCVNERNAKELGRQDKHVYLSYILLCLENAGHVGNPIGGDCEAEIVEFRRLLIDDYAMSPELVMNCKTEIAHYCPNKAGTTVHCLMESIKTYYDMIQSLKPGEQMPDGVIDIAPQCFQAVKQVLKVADTASNYKVDRVFVKACGRTVNTLCSDAADESAEATLSCLMENLESHSMDRECAKRLLEIEYFNARDWTMDPKLYKSCKSEAETKCNAPKNSWGNDGGDLAQSPDNYGMILACLYRHALTDSPDDKLEPGCHAEVERVLHERAVSVNLLPDLLGNCVHDLGYFCKDKTGPGEEILCLQDNLENLEPKCKAQVEQFTEYESKDVLLNRILSRACRPVIEKYCDENLDEDIDSLDTLECLMENRKAPEVTEKCHAYIQHYEIITMKNYKFSNKLKEACKSDTLKHCSEIERTGGRMEEMVMCLSTVIFESRVLEKGSPISKACRKQLRIEYKRIREDEEFVDKKLYKLCKADISKRCSNVKHRPLDCLRDHKQELETPCRDYVFQHEKVEFADQSFDVGLQKACRPIIDTLCAETPKSEALSCLRRVLDHPDMTPQCRDVVRTRMREQARDIRLETGLRKACGEDIKTHCSAEMEQLKRQKASYEDSRNTVALCLLKKFSKDDGQLRPECYEELKRGVMESEVDPTLDPAFYDACRGEMERMCAYEVAKGRGHTGLMECVKAKFYEGRITDMKCENEMRRRTDEALADIHVDAALFEACHTDITHYCKDIQPGHGRIIQCLLDASGSSNVQLQPNCRGKLEDRKKLWNTLYKGTLPVNIADFARIVQASPVKNTFLTILAVVVVIIFIGGLCCGRFTKRVRREMKNR